MLLYLPDWLLCLGGTKASFPSIGHCSFRLDLLWILHNQRKERILFPSIPHIYYHFFMKQNTKKGHSNLHISKGPRKQTIFSHESKSFFSVKCFMGWTSVKFFCHSNSKLFYTQPLIYNLYHVYSFEKQFAEEYKFLNWM